MRRLPDPPQNFFCDIRGVAIKRGDRVAYCRCNDGGLTLAWVLQLDPYLLVLEPDAHPDAPRYTRISDSRQLVIVDNAPVESEVQRALRGIGLAPSS